MPDVCGRERPVRRRGVAAMKTCKDYTYIDVPCCSSCHDQGEEDGEWAAGELVTIKISGEDAYVCCTIASFFYPDGSWKDKSTTGQWSAGEDE